MLRYVCAISLITPLAIAADPAPQPARPIVSQKAIFEEVDGVVAALGLNPTIPEFRQMARKLIGKFAQNLYGGAF